MTSKSVRALLVGLTIATVASLAVGTARADVSQTPSRPPVPPAYEHLSVASLEASGPYIRTSPGRHGRKQQRLRLRARATRQRPRRVLQARRRVACLLAQLGLPHYVFKDDDNPASQKAQVDH